MSSRNQRTLTGQDSVATHLAFEKTNVLGGQSAWSGVRIARPKRGVLQAIEGEQQSDQNGPNKPCPAQPFGNGYAEGGTRSFERSAHPLGQTSFANKGPSVGS